MSPTDHSRADLIAINEGLRQQLLAAQGNVAELKRAVETLNASELRYRVLLDESSDPIFSFSPDGTYRYVNRAFAEGVGKKLEEIVDRKIWDVFPPEEAEKRFLVVSHVFASGQTKVIEVFVPNPSGDRYYVTTVKPILNECNEVASVICISKEITERKGMEEHLRRMSQYDSLTDIPNRALLNDRLLSEINKAKRNGNRLALMALDLDKFKPVNDCFGHQVGDLLLQAVVRRLINCLRESDTLGRIGGDEFVVLLSAIDSDHDALDVAEKICCSLREPYILPSTPQLDVTSSIGIALYPDHGTDGIQLLRNADYAMYRSKLVGGNRATLFQSGGWGHAAVPSAVGTGDIPSLF